MADRQAARSFPGLRNAASPPVTVWLTGVILLLISFASSVPADFAVKEYTLPAGTQPHDVAPAVDGGVWYTAQRKGALGYLDPSNGKTQHIPLGEGSAPHGVIVGPTGRHGSLTAA
jgi:virginiamycin B lyase